MKKPHRVVSQIYTLILSLVFLIPVAWSGEIPEEEVARVVYHADYADPRRFSAMLTSINNMVTHYQNELIDYDAFAS
jgi:hypothetical protein